MSALRQSSDTVNSSPLRDSASREIPHTWHNLAAAAMLCYSMLKLDSFDFIEQIKYAITGMNGPEEEEEKKGSSIFSRLGVGAMWT